MDHARAIEIFKEIQARPYGLSTAPGEPCNNCYFKGIELLQKLGILGYAVRGRVGETYWDKNLIPAAIVDLLPTDILTTHFYTEVFIDDEWCIVDPSLSPAMEKHGFIIGALGKEGRSCFPITKLYTQQESIAYQKKWFDPKYQDDFFTRGAKFRDAVHQWFQEKAA